MKTKGNVIYRVILIAVFGVALLGLGGCAKTKTAQVQETSIVQERVVEYAGEDGKTVCDILKEKYQVDATAGDFGMMVSSINGLKATDKEFWLYSINGKSGEIACDKQTTTNTDKVKWEYKGF